MPTSITDPEFLLLTEVAAIARAPVSSVRGWILTGQLPSLRPGRRVLVRRRDLMEFLERSLRGGRVAPLGGDRS